METTNLDPTSALSGVLGLDTTFFPNPGIRSVSQPPGDRVALPEDPIDNIVEQGALLTVQMEEGIDTLVIKDNNPNGWAYLDNLMFLVR